MLAVKVYDANGKETASFSEVDDSFDFVSLINPETHGPPALVAPFKGSPPQAKIEDRVLFINTAHVPMFSIERISDR